MRRREYAFRPWVRSTCRRAMLWGIGVVVLFGLVEWSLGEPGSSPMSRAFGVLVFYGALFLASLYKIWWTAGRPAVVVDEAGLVYQPLHLFRPKRLAWSSILAAAPKEGTRSYRLVFEARPGRAREFFLNLAVVSGSHDLVAAIGRRLLAEGLAPIPGAPDAFRRPGWEE